MKSHSKYIYSIFGFTFVLLFIVLLINLLIDPLWYFKGNILFPENYSFNERISKTNLYLKSPKKYDCILLGSSRVTLLNAAKIKTNNCFNFAFADGSPSEFIQYAHYIKKYGRQLNTLIVGLDARFFSREKIHTEVPSFIQNLNQADNFLKPYTSLSILDFSFRTLIRDPPQQRYYDANFIGQALNNTKPYIPPECFTLDGFGRQYSTHRLHYFTEIKKTLQPKTFIGYVPPISAWELLPLLEDNEINSRIELIYQASKEFDAFYDFSIPSYITKRTDTSYDGHHFYPKINNNIAEVFSGNTLSFGVAVHKMSFSQYKDEFINALTQFRDAIGKQKRSSDTCPRRSAAR